MVPGQCVQQPKGHLVAERLLEAIERRRAVGEPQAQPVNVSDQKAWGETPDLRLSGGAHGALPIDGSRRPLIPYGSVLPARGLVLDVRRLRIRFLVDHLGGRFVLDNRLLPSPLDRLLDRLDDPRPPRA